MKVQYREDVANRSDPESCVAHREVWGEALTGDTSRPAIEPRNHGSGMPTTLSDSEGNMEHGVNRKPCSDPARSETLRMLGSNLHGSWEISTAPGAIRPGGAGKVNDRNPAIHAVEKSDMPIVPKKPSNKGQPAEVVEGRGVAKGNARETLAGRTQRRAIASTRLAGIREAAHCFGVTYPRQEPCAVIPLAGICAGGRG